MSPPPLAAVTGATGFVGRAVVEAFVREGWRVRALVRRDPPRELWAGPAPQTVKGDLADADALAALAQGADAVVHLAGLIKARDRAAFLRVNVAGAEAVARATMAAGVGRMVHVSSLVAREPHLSDYADSKRGGEAAAAAVVPPDRLTVVRPPAVYGPGDRETSAVFLACARAPLLPRLGPAGARVALVHVADAAGEIVRLAARPGPQPGGCPDPGSGPGPGPGPGPGRPVALGGARPDGYAWEEIFAAAGRAVGRSPPVVPLPRPLVSLAGAASEVVARLTGRPTVFTRGKAREMAHADWSVSPAELGPERRPAGFELDAGFADTVAWLRAEGWLGRGARA